MALEVDYEGPGTESWRSTMYAATVNGASAYVYGYTRNQALEGTIFTASEDREESWLRFATDETTQVVISLADGTDITDAVVYPKNAGVGVQYAAGDVILTVPADRRLDVVINGNEAQPFILLAMPPRSQAPTSYTDFTDLVQTATAVTPANDRITVPAHGYSAGQRILALNSGDMFSVDGTPFTRHEAVYVHTVVDANTFTITTSEGGSQANITAAGTGTLTVVQAHFSVPGGALYFPTGTHDIGREFRIEGDNITVYGEKGAVLTGSFYFRESDYPIFRGYTHSGAFADRDELPYVSGDPELYDYRMYQASTLNDPGSLRGRYAIMEDVLVVNSPHHMVSTGIQTFRRCALISAWYWNTDGFRATSGETQLIEKCYTRCGDDAFFFGEPYCHLTIRDCYSTTAGGGCFHGRYLTAPVSDSSYRIINCDGKHFGLRDDHFDPNGRLGVRGFLKSMTDGTASFEGAGHFNVEIDGLRCWGELVGRLLVLGNTQQYGNETALGPIGEIANWSVKDFWCEELPGQLCRIISRDAVNTPHDLTFIDMEIAGAKITQSNYGEYFDIDPEAYGIEFRSSSVYIPSSSTLGAGMLSELEAVNTMLTTIGASPVNSITGQVSRDVAAAKHVLSEVKATVLLKGWSFNTDYEVPMTPSDTDSRIRVPENTLKIDLDPRESRGLRLDPVQRGDWLYDRYNKSYTWSRSFKVGLVVDLPWDYLPEAARRYIEARAAKLFSARMDADRVRKETAEENEILALQSLMQHETDTGDYTMMDNTLSQGVLLYRRR